MMNVCAEFQSEGFLTCCRSGDMIRHGYYMTRNRSFVSVDELRHEECLISRWTVIVPGRFVTAFRKELEEHKYNAWYLYAKPVQPLGMEKGRWVVERTVKWDRDAYDRPSFSGALDASEIVEALHGRTCIGTLMTVSEVSYPPSKVTRRLLERTRTPAVCLVRNDGSGENISYYRADGMLEAMATVLLEEGVA